MKKRKRQTDRIWQAGLVFALLLLLCGCTRKEDLLLLSGETAGKAEDMSAFSQDAGEETTAADGAGQTAFAGGTGDIFGEETGRVPEGSRQVPDGENRETEAAQESAPSTKPGVIYVHVCGAVEKPGVYELKTGSRVYEAVEQAGGFTGDAEQNYVNQAQVLEDGVKLVIPTREEAAAAGERGTASVAEKPQRDASEKSGIVQEGAGIELGIVGGASQGGQSAGTGGSTGAPADGRININTASETQLCEIPGVGATRAAAIVSYRENHGAFEKPEDIMKVSGIKEGMYEKIKDSISVN